MRLQLVPELSLDRRDVDADPAIVLTRISAWRRFEVATGRSRAVEDDVVLLARIPPQIVERRDLKSRSKKIRFISKGLVWSSVGA